MIITFEDSCWTFDDNCWNRSLTEVLVLLGMRQQHTVLANPDAMLKWCTEHLRLHVEYFKTRLAAGQNRTNALKVKVSPTGGSAVTSDPPWHLTADAIRELVNRPLRLVLENDNSDQLFVESTVPFFSRWCSNGWISSEMGGGSAMERDIAATGGDVVAKWRTFYLFDSDRLHPSELAVDWTPPNGDGCQGYKFEVACADLPNSRWHRLERRSIENYLPQVVLDGVNSAATSALFGSSVGHMAHFYNIKRGLNGDGVSPADPKKTVRASRCKGFWASLPATEISSLKIGFGSSVSDEFRNVPSAYAWPADVLREMDALAEALQDAI